MIVGVITFSFASGSLMSVLTNLNSRAAKLKQKTFELTSIKRKYAVPGNLFEKIYKELNYEIQQDENFEHFFQTLPENYRIELILIVNNTIISKIPYFKDKDKQF